MNVPARRQHCCPECGAPTVDSTVDQPALVRDAGYGATRRNVRRHCTAGCGWALTIEESEVWP